MATPHTVAWIERGAWIAIYAGVIAIILGIVSGEVHVIAGWSLGALGGVAVIAGVVMIVVRSRMTESAQSDPAKGKQ